MAPVFCTRPSTICPSDSANDAGSIVAFRSFTASHTETTLGFCAMAPGSCCVTAWNASEPDTPRFVYAGEPAGRREATSAGHEPFAGSLAPTPTLSDAPMATYLMPELGVAVAGAPLGVAVGARVGEGWLAGAAEQAVTNAAPITLRIAKSRLFLGTIVLPTRTRVRQRTRGCVVSTGQADGPPR